MGIVHTPKFKILLSFVMLLLAGLGSLAFVKKAPAKALNSMQLHFKYQAPGGSYSDENVEEPSNWLRVSEEQICTTDDNTVACSFTIYIPEEDSLSYYNPSTMKGTSRLLIETEGTTEAYVTDVKDNSQQTPPNIQEAINNQDLP